MFGTLDLAVTGQISDLQREPEALDCLAMVKEADISQIKTNAAWMRNIGLAAFLGSWAVIGWLLMYHLPAVLDAKLSPISEKVGRIEEDQKFLLLQNPKLLPDYLRELPKSPQGKKAKLDVATEMVNSAWNENIKLAPDQLKLVSDTLNDVQTTDANVNQQVWALLLRLSGYKTSFIHPGPIPTKSTTQSDCVPNQKVAQVVGFVLDRCTQVLDDVAWIGVKFVNSRVIYYGGEVHLKNVEFVNCVFEMPPTQNSKRIVNTLLASTSPSVSLDIASGS